MTHVTASAKLCRLFLAVVFAVAMVPVPGFATHVPPFFVSGNPDCKDLFGSGSGIQEFKVDDPANGNYGGFTLSNISGGQFDWSSSAPVAAVIAKGGPNANVYFYNPESTGDTGLVTPTNPSNNRPFGLSHVTWCFFPPPEPVPCDINTEIQLFDPQHPQAGADGWVTIVTYPGGQETHVNGFDPDAVIFQITLRDRAVVSCQPGHGAPQGTVTFQLFSGADGEECLGTQHGSDEVVPVSPSGPTSGVAHSAPVTYQNGGHFGYKAAYTSSDANRWLSAETGYCESWPLPEVEVSIQTRVMAGQAAVVELVDGSYVAHEDQVTLPITLHDQVIIEAKHYNPSAANGTVTFRLYKNDTCEGDPAATQADVAVQAGDCQVTDAANGVVTCVVSSSPVDFTLADGGAWAYRASYSDDYGTVEDENGTPAGCEAWPLDFSVHTAFHRAADDSVIDPPTGPVRPGTEIYDTMVITLNDDQSQVAAGWVRFWRFTTADCSAPAGGDPCDSVATCNTAADASEDVQTTGGQSPVTVRSSNFTVGTTSLSYKAAYQAGGPSFGDARDENIALSACEPLEVAADWCSPGYWRNADLAAWGPTGYTPDRVYNTVMTAVHGAGNYPPVTGNPTLGQVLGRGECGSSRGGKKSGPTCGPSVYGGDAFNAVGDLLSAAHPDVNFTGERTDNCPLNNAGVLIQ